MMELGSKYAHARLRIMPSSLSRMGGYVLVHACGIALGCIDAMRVSCERRDEYSADAASPGHSNAVLEYCMVPTTCCTSRAVLTGYSRRHCSNASNASSLRRTPCSVK